MERLRGRVGMVAVGLVLGLAAVACGGDDDAEGGGSASPTEQATSDDGTDEEQIAAAWSTWFDGSIPLGEKLELLEFAEELRPLTEQAQEQNPDAANLNVEVTAVEIDPDGTQAEVIYDLRSGDQVLLPGANGLAVLVDGRWKVSARSYCELLALANILCDKELKDRSQAEFRAG